MRGSLDSAVPVDPTIYRFYELIQVYGPTIKALIHEEFGDGIMSAIDFDMEIQRQSRSQGRSRGSDPQRQVSAVQEVLALAIPSSVLGRHSARRSSRHETFGDVSRF